jgi:beta,beta-carotene 9',10'-dioxygenase
MLALDRTPDTAALSHKARRFMKGSVRANLTTMRADYDVGFRTLTTETAVDSLPLRGTPPPWLTGTLARVAPAQFEAGQQPYNHWFDGLAMLHKFSFAAGRVSYANRYLQSDAYLEARQRQRIARGEFATDPCRTLAQRVAAWFSPEVTDNCNVNVDRLAGQIVAMTETPMPIRFELDTLRTLGKFQYGEGINGALTTAHPHTDFSRNRQYTYVLEFGRTSRYVLISIEPDTGQQSILATIETRRPSYVHSFGMTARHLVFMEFPFQVNPLRLKFSTQPFIRNYRWQADTPTRIHIVAKDSGQVTTRMLDRAIFAFHHVNAFEAGDDLLVDLIAYPDATIIDQLYLERLRSGASAELAGKLTRVRIDRRGITTEEVLSDAPLEFPRIHYRGFAGRPYRYVYGAGNHVPGQFIDKLVKVDLQRSSSLSWHESHCYPGEPVFVAAPEAMEEDDGVILSVVLDARISRSFLLILSARDLQELGRAEAPHAIPFGFHGNYFA